MTGEGFILSRRVVVLSGLSALEFWLTTDRGAVRLTTLPQESVFFITEDQLPSARQALSRIPVQFTFRTLAMRTFSEQTVIGLYFAKQGQIFEARECLRHNGTTLYEGDIRLPERYLMERFIYGSCGFTGQLKPSACFANLQSAKLKPADYQPKFKVLSLDIECSEKGMLYSVGLAAEDYQKVIMIGIPEPAPDWIQWVADEKALLNALIHAVNEYDPDIFIGWNLINFDFKLLIKRAAIYNLGLRLGRGISHGGEVISWREGIGNQGFVNIAGRVIIDGIDALKTATWQFDSFSLEAVAQSLLGKGKRTEDVDNRLATINYDFIHNKVKLAEYNLQDCTLVLEIFAKTRLLEFLVLRSKLTGLALDRSGGSVAAFINLYLPKLHRAGYVAPNRPADGGLASPGGYVMSSRPGLYKNVLVLDFKSLYPSIIRTFKIDPLGLIEGLKRPEKSIQGYRGALFSRERHFLPDIITSLWQQRDQAKVEQDAARSQAIKILMNSFYGVLGSGGCPFYDPRLASSITLRGHEIMQTTAKWIEAQGHTVIYGDTDSTFVWIDEDLELGAVQQIGHSLQDMINQKWQRRLKEQFGLPCYLEIEFETCFSRFLMPTVRGSDKGSKKRYAGLKVTQNSEKLVFKGLESVRSDWTLLAKRFQTRLYQLIFAEQDVAHYIRHTLKRLHAGELDDSLVYRKRLRRPLSDYVKNVPPHVKAARAADAKNAEQSKTQRYQRKGTISYLMTVSGPQAVEHQSAAIDYQHYIDKQIKPVADGILHFVDLTFEELTGQQMGLF